MMKHDALKLFLPWLYVPEMKVPEVPRHHNAFVIHVTVAILAAAPGYSNALYMVN